MKNKYGHRLHISERRFREAPDLFCADPRATKTAEPANPNRNTANALLSRIRTRMAELAGRGSRFTAGETEIGEPHFVARRVKGKRGRGAAGRAIAFGMKKRGGKVHTQLVKSRSAPELLPIVRARALGDPATYSDGWKAYDGPVSFGYREHHRARRSGGNFASGGARINGMESFWGAAKTRMAKFWGFDKGSFRRHLKETESRLNHRQDNLCGLPLKEFGTSPL